MRVAKEDVDVRMEIPGAVVRQRREFGSVKGYDTISGEYFSLSAGWIRPRCSLAWPATSANAHIGASCFGARS